ncbi:MAG: DUF4159 domain-containing protein [Planctomycetota bacterium]
MTTRQLPLARPVLSAAVAAACLWAAPEAAAADQPPPPAIRSALKRATRFLQEQIGPDGRAVGEYPPDSRRALHGGRTALTAYALLASGADESSGRLSRVMEWLVAAKLDGTYARSLRACALAETWAPRYREPLAADVAWLLKAAGPDGAYSYRPRDDADDPYDNSCSQMAALGLYRAAARGIEIPRRYWRVTEQHWLDEQQPDGGWGYRIPPAAARTRPYGSMTAAGLVTLYACSDALRREDFVRCRDVPRYEPIVRAHAWLGEHFSADENPLKGVEWYYYWLFCVGRVGRVSGYKYFGRHDWYARAASALLDAQNPDGSWGVGDRPQRASATALAVLFLARGRAPILATKLQYEGAWNPRPRDLAHLARWLTRAYERPLSWQVLPDDAPPGDWRDAPILYISGAGPIEMTDAQVDRLRRFALTGGLIISEAACNSGSFTVDMRKVYQRAFPRRPLQRLGRDHPIFTMQGGEPLRDRWGLSGVSNGVRLLAIHAPRELSKALQLGADDEADRSEFELLGNVYLLATGRGQLLPRGADRWPEEPDRPAERTIAIARLKHEGNCDPEPLAWRRLALLAGADGVALDLAGPLAPVELRFADHPVAVMTGTEAFTWTEEELTALRRFVRAGGTLIVDAAGGAPAFAAAARRQLPFLVPGGRLQPLPSDHPVYRAAEPVTLRKQYARSLPPDAPHKRLQAVYTTGDGDTPLRPAVVFSAEDLTAGLVGYPGFDVAGYTPETCARLMSAILRFATRPESTSQPATQPATRASK